MIENIIWSAVGGAIVGLVGYLKNLKENGTTQFDTVAILSTVIGSAVIGGLSTSLGMTSNELESASFGVVLTQLIKKGWSIVK